MSWNVESDGGMRASAQMPLPHVPGERRVVDYCCRDDRTRPAVERRAPLPPERKSDLNCSPENSVEPSLSRRAPGESRTRLAAARVGDTTGQLGAQN
ncbi:MAG TPA: hypothetical protein VF656_00695 [Pyrinomonadaceae bacterium]